MFMRCWSGVCVGVKGKRGRDERRERRTAVGAMFVCMCVCVVFFPAAQLMLIPKHRKKNVIVE